MPARHGGRDAGGAVEQGEAEARPGRKQAAERGGGPSQQQGEQETRHRDAGERNGDQVREHADRRHRAERVSRDGRGQDRGGGCWGDEPHQTVALHGRAPRPDHRRDGRDREPCADGMHRPGIDQHDGERSERDGASRRDHALAQPRDTGHREHDGGARRRRREAEQP